MLQTEGEKMRIKKGGIRKSAGEIQSRRCRRQAVATDVANNSIAGKDEARITFGAIIAMQLLMTIAAMLAAGKLGIRGWDGGRELNYVRFKPG